MFRFLLLQFPDFTWSLSFCFDFFNHPVIYLVLMIQPSVSLLMFIEVKQNWSIRLYVLKIVGIVNLY